MISVRASLTRERKRNEKGVLRERARPEQAGRRCFERICRSLTTEYFSELRASCLQDDVSRLVRGGSHEVEAMRLRVDLPDLWSSYEGQTVDALAVGGDEGRG